jgi:MSHA pilin protein MshB
MNKQNGFTLVELVIVVVILGFLAVTAIPKFLDLTEQAKEANIEGMAGGFATAISLARAQWEAEGRPNNGTSNAVNYDGVNVLLTTEDDSPVVRPGYVVGVVGTTADSAANLGGGFNNQACVTIWENILQQPPSITSTFNNLNATTGSAIDYFAAEDGSLCYYYLKDTLVRDASNNYVNPSNSTSVGNNFTYSPATSKVTVNINVN